MYSKNVVQFEYVVIVARGAVIVHVVTDVAHVVIGAAAKPKINF